MNRINLDPTKLLGFKIIADRSRANLSSPKIGIKGCNVHAEDEGGTARIVDRTGQAD